MNAPRRTRYPDKLVRQMQPGLTGSNQGKLVWWRTSTFRSAGDKYKTICEHTHTNPHVHTHIQTHTHKPNPTRADKLKPTHTQTHTQRDTNPHTHKPTHSPKQEVRLILHRVLPSHCQ